MDGRRIILPRILMFNPLFYPVVGGAERQTELLAASLVQRGITAEVLTVRMQRQWPLNDQTPSGVRIRRVAFNDICRKFPRVRGLGVLNTLLLGRQIAREVRASADRFDILHAFNASQPSTAFAVRAARSAKLLTIARAVSTRECFDLTVLRREPIWGGLARRSLLGNVDCWIAISEAVGGELVTAGIEANRIRRLPNGAVLLSHPRELPDVATRFLHLGRLARTAPRDIAGLIRAFETVVSSCPEAELALVGDGDQLAATREMVASSRAADRIVLPGEGDGGQWRQWAHCQIHPSFLEGMSNALLEGMAAGLACIAYDIPPNREVLGDGSAGILVNVGDHTALADAMTSMTNVPGLARTLGGQGRARAESLYDIRNVAARTESLYRQLLEEGR